MNFNCISSSPVTNVIADKTFTLSEINSGQCKAWQYRDDVSNPIHSTSILRLGSGRLDKRGKEIFEYDIIAHELEQDHIIDSFPAMFEVKFGKYCIDKGNEEDIETWHQGFYLRPFDTDQECWSLAWNPETDYTVVGNIFSNPEMPKESMAIYESLTIDGNKEKMKRIIDNYKAKIYAIK
jgi:uncharacterized phage protein (TIGR01671 family)